MTLTWRDLLVETVRDPAEAGRMVMSVALPRRDIWLSVVAVAALNAVLSAIVGLVSPAPPEAADTFPMLAVGPFAQALIIGGLLVLLAHLGQYR